MTDLFARLAAEFPRDAIHWRAQTLTSNGDKALALAYLDARDVMDRLDEVCTPAGWRDSYVETARGRVIGTIEVLIDGQWVGKSDGAGDTDVEGEKGGMSDAFKRAGVKWGIGRYLYRLPAVWAPCETYERNGKKQWKAWKGSPWDSVRGLPQPAKQAPSKPAELSADAMRMIDAIEACDTVLSLTQWRHANQEAALANPDAATITDRWNARKAEVQQMDSLAA